MNKNLIILILLGLSFPYVCVKSNQNKLSKTELKPVAIRTIEADFNQEKGATSRVWRKCIGAGRANEGLRADWQNQLRLVKNECGFEYIRMHGLLHDDMGVYFEDKKGNPIYNWQYIDQLYDFLLSINVKPFVELSFMPAALASGNKTIFWWKGNITPPKDYNKWYELIKALTEHFTERYGKVEVSTWYFEVWNEPNLNLFFTGNKEEYMKLYDYTVKAVKSVNLNYKVGGPATAGNAWINEIIEHCTINNTPIDFISTHNYSVTKGFLDADGDAGTALNPNKRKITDDAIKSKNTIQKSAKPNLELHYTEWSSSYTPTDPVHDTYHSPAFILENIKGTEDVANSMSYWVFTDIFEENGPRATPFHGGFGLLNVHSIKKPAYFAYEFLNKLGSTDLKTNDAESWVCKNKKGDIQILFWDFTITHPTDSVNNQIYYKRDLPSKTKGNVQVKLNNVPKGKYKLRISKVGYKSNDAYATYMELGSPSQLTVKQVDFIKNSNSGLPYLSEIIRVSDDMKFSYQLSMHENDVFLIELIKVKR